MGARASTCIRATKCFEERLQNRVAERWLAEARPTDVSPVQQEPTEIEATQAPPILVEAEAKVEAALEAIPSKSLFNEARLRGAFSDDWWCQYGTPESGFVDSRGKVLRLPMRFESAVVIIYGFVDPDKLWAEFYALDEEFYPVLIGGKAVVAIWLKDYTDTDCGGAYSEILYSTFVTRKGEQRLELNCRGPFSAIITNPRSLTYMLRVVCSEAPVSTGAATTAVEAGRSIYGFPTHPELGQISLDYVDEGKTLVCNATHSGKKAMSLRVELPEEGAEATITGIREEHPGTSAIISGPRLGGTSAGLNGAHQTEYSVTSRSTQHMAIWNTAKDYLEFGDDDHFARLIKGWDFQPALKLYSPDWMTVQHQPSNWLADSAAATRQGKRNFRRFREKWWRQFDKPVAGFVDSGGAFSRLPIRLQSTVVIVYGLVNAGKMWAEFEALGEPFLPVLVGGKAVVTVWFNNFIDSDCGGAYLETWYSTFVTPKGEPQLDLPYDMSLSAFFQEPRSLSYMQRMLCGEVSNGICKENGHSLFDLFSSRHIPSRGAGAVAVEGGRSIFGFPRHPDLGKISYQHFADEKRVSFVATHLGKWAVCLQLEIPYKGAESSVSIPLEMESGPDALISGPRLGGVHRGHNGAHQSRYGVAMKCTQHVAHWDASTDSLEFGDDAHYASPIKSWDFEPAIKVFSPDCKMIFQMPSNWISDSEAAQMLRQPSC